MLTFIQPNLKFGIWNFIMNRPPPYFPQNQLSPPDENRYKKFKVIIALVALFVIALLVGAGFGIYYLISWLAK